MKHPASGDASEDDRARSVNYSPPLVVPAALAGLRFDQALAKMLPEHSRSRLAAWIRTARVRIDGAPSDTKRKVWGGERVEIDLDSALAEAADRAESIALPIVHEDASILVIDKPAGLVVHPGSGNRTGTLLNALLAHAPALAALPRAGIVHRLDKDTSGLLVVAKTLEAQTCLVRQLQARTVKRDYVAVVHGRIERSGTVEAPIGRDPRVRTRMAVVSRGKPARTLYRPLERLDTATIIECSLETGRTHQIRVHMRSIGHPIVGDPTYGPRRAGERVGIDRQALHAARLGLAHPDRAKPMSWRSPLPADIESLVATLRGGG